MSNSKIMAHDRNYITSLTTLYIMLATVSNEQTDSLYQELIEIVQSRFSLSISDTETFVGEISQRFSTIQNDDDFTNILSEATSKVRKYAKKTYGKESSHFLIQLFDDLVELAFEDDDLSQSEQLLLDFISAAWQAQSSGELDLGFISGVSNLFCMISTVSNPFTESLVTELLSKLQEALELDVQDSALLVEGVLSSFENIDDELIIENIFNQSCKQVKNYAQAFDDFSLLKLLEDMIKLAFEDGEISDAERDLLNRIAESWGLILFLDGDKQINNLDPEEAYVLGVSTLFSMMSTASNPHTKEIFIGLLKTLTETLQLPVVDSVSLVERLLVLFHNIEEGETFEHIFQQSCLMVKYYNENFETDGSLQTLLTNMVNLAFADGEISSAEQELMDRISKSWGFDHNDDSGKHIDEIIDEDELEELVTELSPEASSLDLDEDTSYMLGISTLFCIISTVSNPPTEELFEALLNKLQQRLDLSIEDSSALIETLLGLFANFEDEAEFEKALKDSTSWVAMYAQNNGGSVFLRQLLTDLSLLAFEDGEISEEEHDVLDRISLIWGI